MSTQTIMTPQANPRSSLAMATDPGRALHLSSTFQPDVDLLIAEFLLVYGSKGSGKSNLLALLVEQLARFHVPQLILDTEGEFAGLLPFLPRGVLASASACPSASDIVHHGLQVVLDLKSWEEEEQAGQAMAKLIGSLFAVTNAIECTSRWPVVVHLDEAAYWLPQDAVSYLSKGNYTAPPLDLNQ